MTTSSPFGTPIWNWLINPPTKVIDVHSLPYSSAVPYKLDYMLEVAVLRIGIPWTFSFSFAYVRALRCPNFSHYSYPYSVGYYHTKEHLCCHLSKCWYAPPFSLYCRTHRARDDQNCQNMSSICFCMPHVGPMLAKSASYCLHLSRTWFSV